MGKMKELGQYLQGVCIHFADLQDELSLPGDPPLPIADFVNDRIEDGKTIIVRHCQGCDELEEDVIEQTGTDFIYIADAPNDEDPYGTYPSSRICQALIIQFRNTYGPEPDGARLYAKFERGSDGYTVCCEYTYEKPYSVAYAFMLESNTPDKWTPAAKRYLETGK